MIDISKIEYRVVIIAEDGTQYNIKNYIQNLGWEENKNEISVRSTFKVKNDDTSRGYLSELIKPGCLVGIYATDGKFDEEVARGYVETWNPVLQSASDELKCTNYDELYRLQKSQDNIYFPAGTGTQSAIETILDDWEIPQGEYHGPNAAHGKLKYSSQYLSDVILDLLNDAVKKGEERCIIRAAKGYTSVIPRGGNDTVYVFREDNSKQVSNTLSTADLVTRVKVIGQADDDGNSSVEATLNGITEFGIRQRIYIRGTDETLADAKSAAQEILNEKGIIQNEVTVAAPDVPFIRKGDLVYLMAGTAQGYYYVDGIRHDADTYSMSMDLSNNETVAARTYNVDDVVYFNGGAHYVSSGSDAKGYAAAAGPARITIKNDGSAHPWHLIHEDGESNVYGWVDDGTFE